MKTTAIILCQAVSYAYLWLQMAYEQLHEKPPKKGRKP